MDIISSHTFLRSIGRIQSFGALEKWRGHVWKNVMVRGERWASTLSLGERVGLSRKGSVVSKVQAAGPAHCRMLLLAALYLIMGSPLASAQQSNNSYQPAEQSDYSKYEKVMKKFNLKKIDKIYIHRKEDIHIIRVEKSGFCRHKNLKICLTIVAVNCHHGNCNNFSAAYAPMTFKFHDELIKRGNIFYSILYFKDHKDDKEYVNFGVSEKKVIVLRR